MIPHIVLAIPENIAFSPQQLKIKNGANNIVRKPAQPENNIGNGVLITSPIGIAVPIVEFYYYGGGSYSQVYVL